MTLIIGIPACAKHIDGEWQHATPARYGAALLGAAGAVPLLIPPTGQALGEAQLAVLDRLDGLLLSGSPSNVHPTIYGGGESETPEFHDPERDATTLPLIRAALARGMPVLAICRGIQELNVALGGTLHQRVHNVPDRLDHRAGPGSMEEKFGIKHPVRLCGELALMVGATELSVNSLHGQALDRLAPGLVVEARAPDGTVEAVRVADARSFAFGIQWHPEWNYAATPASLAVFRAFGDACRAYRARLGEVP